MIEDISRRYFDNRVYSVVIIDVNSLFLFGGQYTIKYMYEFIDTLKKVINNDNAIIINVIDNGLNLKMLRDHPNYKANRITSVYNNTTTINHFSNRKSFKYKISQIHKIDSKFKNHLTFYLQGESDFKIGYIIQ
jgi:archaellum biogenesis ATPase FlaH